MKSYKELKELGIFVISLKESCYGIKIGRPHLLGNPFLIGRDGNREEVIEKYKIWLWKEIRKKSEVWKELVRIFEIWKRSGKVALACWCFPELCHAQVIGSCLVWMEKKGGPK